MRWVFYGLLVINIIFFSWQTFVALQDVDAVQDRVGIKGDVAPIQLLTELGEDKDVKLEKRSAAQKCDVYGPFFAVSDSQSFLTAVKIAGVKGREEAEQVRLKPYYWIYVPPLRSQIEAQAMVNRLRGYQLHAELINDGDFRNGVALGNVETRDEVQRLQQRLFDQGITVKSIEKSRDYKQFWVVLDPGSAALIEGELQDRLINEHPDIFHQQKVCKPVASGF